jgi:flagellar secretion chaperone FliS
MTAMAVGQRARHAYQVSQVAEQDPMSLIVMLYDGMLGFLERGIDAVEQGDRVGVGEHVRRASDIVGELQAVLNLEEGDRKSVV